MKKKRIVSDLTLISLFYVALGVILLGWPELSSRIICYAFGGVLTVSGILRIVRYFLRDQFDGMIRKDFCFGLVLAAGGLFLILRPDTVVSFLPFVFGLLLVAGCAEKLQTAADLRRIGIPLWYIPLIMGGVSLVLGIILLCQPFGSAMILTRFIGVAIIVEGVENLAALPIFERKLQDHYSDRM